MAATQAATLGKSHTGQKTGLGGFLRFWLGGMTSRSACRQQLNKSCLAPSVKSLKSLVSGDESQRIKPKRALTPALHGPGKFGLAEGAQQAPEIIKAVLRQEHAGAAFCVGEGEKK